MIDWLVRKPGAFESYRYMSDMFPTSYFRMAYDALKERWDDISGIRKALLSDFKYFSVRDQQLFHDFIRELMLMRIDLKKLDNRDALEIFKRLYS